MSTLGFKMAQTENWAITISRGECQASVIALAEANGSREGHRTGPWEGAGAARAAVDPRRLRWLERHRAGWLVGNPVGGYFHRGAGPRAGEPRQSRGGVP